VVRVRCRHRSEGANEGAEVEKVAGVVQVERDQVWADLYYAPDLLPGLVVAVEGGALLRRLFGVETVLHEQGDDVGRPLRPDRCAEQ
jgi:hypothetical protein